MEHTLSETTIDGFPALLLGAPAAGVEAAFAPGAGMVGCSLRHDGTELLGQRGGLPAYAERGSSFGIPLLHPWANRLAEPRYRVGGDVVELDFDRMPLRPDENGLPIHGVLAGSPDWRIASTGSGAGGARLEAALDFGAHPELLAAFPFPHELTLAVELAGARLTVTTRLRATGVVPVPVSFGFHPYLQLPGVPRGEWIVTLPVRSRALLDARGIPTGETEDPPFTGGALGDRSFDDLFPELEPSPGGANKGSVPVFAVEGGGRRTAVEFLEGYPIAQVYSPADADFICFEPMTAPTNALCSREGLRTVPPGETFTAAFALVVEQA